MAFINNICNDELYTILIASCRCHFVLMHIKICFPIMQDILIIQFISVLFLLSIQICCFNVVIIDSLAFYFYIFSVFVVNTNLLFHC